MTSLDLLRLRIRAPPTTWSSSWSKFKVLKFNKLVLFFWCITPSIWLEFNGNQCHDLLFVSAGEAQWHHLNMINTTLHYAGCARNWKWKKDGMCTDPCQIAKTMSNTVWNRYGIKQSFEDLRAPNFALMKNGKGTTLKVTDENTGRKVTFNFDGKYFGAGSFGINFLCNSWKAQTKFYVVKFERVPINDKTEFERALLQETNEMALTRRIEFLVTPVRAKWWIVNKQNKGLDFIKNNYRSFNWVKLNKKQKKKGKKGGGVNLGGEAEEDYDILISIADAGIGDVEGVMKKAYDINQHQKEYAQKNPTHIRADGFHPAWWFPDSVWAIFGMHHAVRKLHFDIKPENLLLMRDGRVTLIDFDGTMPPVMREGQKDTHHAHIGVHSPPWTQWGNLCAKWYRAEGDRDDQSVVYKEFHKKVRFLPQADLFSLGISLFQNVVGTLDNDAHPYLGCFPWRHYWSTEEGKEYRDGRRVLTLLCSGSKEDYSDAGLAKTWPGDLDKNLQSSCDPWIKAPWTAHTHSWDRSKGSVGGGHHWLKNDNARDLWDLIQGATQANLEWEQYTVDQVLCHPQTIKWATETRPKLDLKFHFKDTDHKGKNVHWDAPWVCIEWKRGWNCALPRRLFSDNYARKMLQEFQWPDSAKMRDGTSQQDANKHYYQAVFKRDKKYYDNSVVDGKRLRVYDNNWGIQILQQWNRSGFVRGNFPKSINDQNLSSTLDCTNNKQEPKRYKDAQNILSNGAQKYHQLVEQVESMEYRKFNDLPVQLIERENTHNIDSALNTGLGKLFGGGGGKTSVSSSTNRKNGGAGKGGADGSLMSKIGPIQIIGFVLSGCVCCCACCVCLCILLASDAGGQKGGGNQNNRRRNVTASADQSSDGSESRLGGARNAARNMLNRYILPERFQFQEQQVQTSTVAVGSDSEQQQQEAQALTQEGWPQSQISQTASSHGQTSLQTEQQLLSEYFGGNLSLDSSSDQGVLRGRKLKNFGPKATATGFPGLDKLALDQIVAKQQYPKTVKYPGAKVKVLVKSKVKSKSKAYQQGVTAKKASSVGYGTGGSLRSRTVTPSSISPKRKGPPPTVTPSNTTSQSFIGSLVPGFDYMFGSNVTDTVTLTGTSQTLSKTKAISKVKAKSSIGTGTLAAKSKSTTIIAKGKPPNLSVSPGPKLRASPLRVKRVKKAGQPLVVKKKQKGVEVETQTDASLMNMDDSISQSLSRSVSPNYQTTHMAGLGQNQFFGILNHLAGSVYDSANQSQIDNLNQPIMVNTGSGTNAIAQTNTVGQQNQQQNQDLNAQSFQPMSGRAHNLIDVPNDGSALRGRRFGESPYKNRQRESVTRETMAVWMTQVPRSELARILGIAEQDLNLEALGEEDRERVRNHMMATTTDQNLSGSNTINRNFNRGSGGPGGDPAGPGRPTGPGSGGPGGAPDEPSQTPDSIPQTGQSPDRIRQANLTGALDRDSAIQDQQNQNQNQNDPNWNQWVTVQHPNRTLVPVVTTTNIRMTQTYGRDASVDVGQDTQTLNHNNGNSQQHRPKATVPAAKQRALVTNIEDSNENVNDFDNDSETHDLPPNESGAFSGSPSGYVSRFYGQGRLLGNGGENEDEQDDHDQDEESLNHNDNSLMDLSEANHSEDNIDMLQENAGTQQSMSFEDDMNQIHEDSNSGTQSYNERSPLVTRNNNGLNNLNVLSDNSPSQSFDESFQRPDGPESHTIEDEITNDVDDNYSNFHSPGTVTENSDENPINNVSPSTIITMPSPSYSNWSDLVPPSPLTPTHLQNDLLVSPQAQSPGFQLVPPSPMNAIVRQSRENLSQIQEEEDLLDQDLDTQNQIPRSFMNQISPTRVVNNALNSLSMNDDIDIESDINNSTVVTDTMEVTGTGSRINRNYRNNYSASDYTLNNKTVNNNFNSNLNDISHSSAANNSTTTNATNAMDSTAIGSTVTTAAEISTTAPSGAGNNSTAAADSRTAEAIIEEEDNSANIMDLVDINEISAEPESQILNSDDEESK